MKKNFFNWVGIFGATLLMLVILFCYFEMKDQLKPPSKDWSKAVLIGKVADSEVSQSSRVRVATVEIPEDKMFITFWNDIESLNYVYIDENGKRLAFQKLNLKLDEPVLLKAILLDQYIYLYSLEGGMLNKYKFDYKSQKISYEGIVSNNVLGVQVYEKNLYLSGENDVKVIGINGGSTLIAPRKAEAVDVYEDLDHSLHIAYLSPDDIGTKHLFYTTGTKGNYRNESWEIGQIMLSTDEFDNIDNIIIGEIGSKINVIVPIRNFTQKNGRIIIYSFDKDNPQKVSVEELGEFYQHNPNPVYISKNGSSIDFLVTKSLPFGNRTNTVNIQKYSLTGTGIEQKELLTRLKNISSNPTYFKLGNSTYLQWENKLPWSTNIVYASTNSNVKKLASEFSLGNFIDALLSCMVAIFFSLTSALLICPMILIPTVLIIGVLIILFLFWVENHSERATFGIILVHTMSELFFTAYMFKQNHNFMELAPGFLHNGPTLYIIIAALCLIPYLCMKLRFKNKKLDGTFLYRYSFFVLLNFVLYSLLVFPWRYI